MNNNTTNNIPELSSKIIPTSISLFLFAIFLLPLILLLIIILYKTKRLLHLNTRILLSVVPLSVILSLTSRICFLLMAICENPARFMEIAVYYPAFFANFFINSLPITIGLEKLISTLFCKYYEKNKRLRFVGIGILAIQLITALLFSIIRFNLTSKENNSQNISSLQHTIFNNLQIILPQSSIILPVFFLLFWNTKLSVQNQNSPQNSISCRYQLRENCRTLRFCLFFVFLLGASTFIQILLHTFNDEESRTLFFNVNYSDKHFGTLEEFLALFPQTLALLGTLLGHKSIRLSLLSLFGIEVSAMERAVTKQNKNLHINTVNGSLSSSFSSNRTARVSDAKSVNELIRDAHFDILQNYWEKKT
uniref:Uncharacterized protein n=1 Tax=Meloidogyne enterolobii TaxID=390850 RepID=A0A6V7UGC4_MELEN|nr:unnamed protein product [Meloidogyne enterolobii]